nr:hypothetical protein CPGR_00660 [Mycolicibacterium fortuitum subsp. fortuitum DSM 46621 = ATCC 6841 = JCM 6387]
MRQIQIVDDLADQFVKTLDERHTGIAVPGHTKGFQHDLAELMCGGDRGGIETGQGVAQPLPPHQLVVGDQVLQQIVVGA